MKLDEVTSAIKQQKYEQEVQKCADWFDAMHKRNSIFDQLAKKVILNKKNSDAKIK